MRRTHAALLILGIFSLLALVAGGVAVGRLLHLLEPAAPLPRRAAGVGPEGDREVEVVVLVLSEEQEILKGARVELRPATGEPGARRTAGVAGDDGRVTLRVDAQETYRLRAAAPGHQTAEIRGGLWSREEPVRIQLSRGGAIHGRVTSLDGEPLDGAEVRLRSWQRTDLLGRLLIDVTSRAISAKGGRFTLDGLPPADGVVIEAHLGGFLPGRSEDLVLEAGEELRDVEIVLSPGAGTIEGVVVDPDGAPVSVANVGVAWSDLETFPEASWPDAEVSPDGRFRFDTLHLGTYTLSYSAPGHPYSGPSDEVRLTADEPRREVVLRLDRGVRVDGRVTDREGQPLAGARVASAMAHTYPVFTDANGRFVRFTRAGKKVLFSRPGYVRRELEVTPDLVSPVTVLLEPAVWLSVSVDSPSPLPPFAASVTVVGDPPPGRARGELLAHRELAVRDPEGVFHVDLPRGHATVTVRVPGFRPSTGRIELTGEPPAGGPGAALAIALDAGVKLEGRVVNSVDGRPVPGALVALQRAVGLPRFLAARAGHDPNVDEQQARSGPDGRFQLSGVSADPWLTWRLWTRAPGFGAESSLPFLVEARTALPEIVLEVAPEARVLGKVAGWESPGDVVLRTREALEAATSPFSREGRSRRLTTLDRVLGLGRPLDVGLSTETYARRQSLRRDGTFSFRELPAGLYTLSLLGWTQRFTLDAGEVRHVEVALGEAGRRRGVLLREDEPLPGAFVEAGDFEAMTDDDGHFEGVPAGQQRLGVRLSPLGAVTYVDAYFDRPEDDPVEVHLGTAALDGSLELAGPVPADWEARLLEVATGDPDGPRRIAGRARGFRGKGTDRFRMEGLTPGHYQLRVVAGAYHLPWSSDVFPLRDGERRQVEIRLEAPAKSLEGPTVRVVGPDDRPIVGALARVVASPSLEWTTDRLGEFVLGPLPAGRYIVSLEPGLDHRRFPLTLREIRLPVEGAERSVELRPGRGGRLVLRCVDEQARPLPNARIELFDPLGPDVLGIERASAMTPRQVDDDGVLSVAPLAPGSYRVEARWRDLESPRAVVEVEEGVETGVVLTLRRPAGR
ncbi:MAG: carboxypeptidase regulatory-like domain-containing protein [Planctomycetota bacterium]|nr:carboxypeptidase regulatory-like domain-containing protein [Planctomycetota bacterium]